MEIVLKDVEEFSKTTKINDIKKNKENKKDFFKKITIILSSIELTLYFLTTIIWFSSLRYIIFLIFSSILIALKVISIVLINKGKIKFLVIALLINIFLGITIFLYNMLAPIVLMLNGTMIIREVYFKRSK